MSNDPVNMRLEEMGIGLADDIVINTIQPCQALGRHVVAHGTIHPPLYSEKFPSSIPVFYMN